MKSIFKCVVAIAVLTFTGCAGMQPASTTKETAQKAEPAAKSPPRTLIIFIPQTDQGAQNWLKLFDKYPDLRMVIAMSPRFNRFSKELPLKEKALALQKAGRLELALQLPNAPFLPLLINTDAAKNALPPNSPLPTPPFTHPEDVAQIIAKARVDFSSRTWQMTPKGLVLPQGAVNADLLKSLNQLSLGWVVGALAAPATDGAYHVGNLQVWDATPVQENPHFMVQVWDERLTGNAQQSLQMLNTWAQDLAKRGAAAVLPSDPELPIQDLPANGTWGNRTWTTQDWSGWIGSAHKNAAWSWLKTTRDALESFKNSGQASVRRLDMAFEEIYNAENANYFSGITEGETTFTLAEDREKEFKATLSSVYRLIGQPPPENLFSTVGVSAVPGVPRSSTTVTWESLPSGIGHLTIEDAAGDDNGDGHLTDLAGAKTVPGTTDLRKVEVFISSETLDWTITLGSLAGNSLGSIQTHGPLIDIYLDLNGQPNVGTRVLLPNRGAPAAPSDAWEYAISLWGTQGQFYRTRGEETYDMPETVPLRFEPGRVRFTLPRDWLRGNPQRWGYQTLVMMYDPQSLESEPRPLVTPEMSVAKRLPIFDLIDPMDTPQAQLLTDIEEGKRSDIPFIRLNSIK